MDEFGKRHRVAHIYLVYDPELESTVFTVSNSKGEELFPPNANLYILKKQIITLEPEFMRTVRDQVQEKKGVQRDAKNNFDPYVISTRPMVFTREELEL